MRRLARTRGVTRTGSHVKRGGPSCRRSCSALLSGDQEDITSTATLVIVHVWTKLHRTVLIFYMTSVLSFMVMDTVCGKLKNANCFGPRKRSQFRVQILWRDTNEHSLKYCPHRRQMHRKGNLLSVSVSPLTHAIY